MSIKVVRQVLKKDRKTIKVLTALIDQMELTVHIHVDGKSYWGSPSQDLKVTSPILLSEKEIAILESNKVSGKLLAQIISEFVRKEWEKKQIGQEVLGLYREINMIYDFSEKIAEKIDAGSIAEIALSEAHQIIDSTQGLFMVVDSRNNISILASFGIEGLDQIKMDTTRLNELIALGQSAIVTPDRISELPNVSHLSSLMYAPLKVKNNSYGLIMLGDQSEVEYTAAELKLLTTIALQSASAMETARLYQRGLAEVNEREAAIRNIHEVSNRFVPYEIIRSLGKESLMEVNLGDQVEKEVTVMFTDIRDFTSLSEGLSPEENFLFVNAFNERMGPIIRKHKGFINQYLGDGFMAIFTGNPQEAVRASVEMQNTLKEYNIDRKEKDRKAIRLGIGMQTGRLIMGITGDKERMDAATISDTVNTASRIESLSKHYGTSVLLSGESIDKLSNRNEFDFRYLGLVQVKGKVQPLKIFECINGDDEVLYKHKMDTLITFKEGMELYFEKQFAMAAVTFQEVFKKHSGDLPAKHLLNRSAQLITAQVAKEWRGIEEVLVK